MEPESHPGSQASCSCSLESWGGAIPTWFVLCIFGDFSKGTKLRDAIPCILYNTIYILYIIDIDQEWSRRFCFAKNEVPVEFQHPPAASSIFLKWQHHLWRSLEIRDPPPNLEVTLPKQVRLVEFGVQTLRKNRSRWKWRTEDVVPTSIVQTGNDLATTITHPSSASRIFMFRYWPETKVGSRVQDYVQWTTAALLSLISHTPPFHGMCRHTGCPRRVQRALLKELCWVHSGRSALGEFVWWLLDTVGSKHFFTLRAAIIPSLGRQLTMLGRAGSPASFTWPAGESTDSQSTHRALLVRGRVFQGTEARSVDYHCSTATSLQMFRESKIFAPTG